jgi:hypothetical protein
MKHFLVVAIVLYFSVSADAALTLTEIRTASDNVLVAYFKSTIINANEVNTAALSSGGLQSQSQSMPPRMGIGNWHMRNHRWDVPMGEVLQTSPWERSPSDGKSSYTGRT